MAVPTWQPGTLYQPGDLVQPITAPPATAAQVENGDFAAGNVNWDFTGGAEFATTGGYSGNGNCVRMPGSVPDGLALNKTKLVVPSTGSTFEATAMINQGASIAGATRGWVEVRWFDIGDVQIAVERGNVVSDGSGGAWHQSKITATRPAGAAYARAGIALFSVADHSHPIWGDNLSVSGTFAGLPDGLVYKAVQPESGFSASDEPAWPPILGQQVIDNEVIWEAVASTRVTWEASPLYVSGATEPAWPTEIGGFVRDGTINWRTVSRRVEDTNCPDSKIVTIAASKVFVGDDDIVRYSATVNPLDYTTANDAGYLPTGLQNYGSNPVSGMGLYRGNLVVFNSEAFQLWQVDEDPASMALIDALPLGSTQHRSIAPVSNDLFFASSQGVRSIGIAASSTNYQAGDVGMPIDPLVEPMLRLNAAADASALGLYNPSAGQYWIAFAGFPASALAFSGNLPDGNVGDVIDYSYTVSGGVNPKVVTLQSGALPTGTELTPAGRVLGQVTVGGTYSWVLRLTDGTGSYIDLPDTATYAMVDLGTEWEYTGLFGKQINDITYGDGVFLAVGQSLSPDKQIWTSPTGEPGSWVQQANGVPDGWSFTSCAFGNGTFVVSRGFNNVLVGSISGGQIAWVPRTTVNADAYGITIWSGLGFIRLGHNGTAEYSPNGVTWTNSPRPSTQTANVAFRHGNAVVVLCGNGGIHRTSNNGATWTTSTVTSDPLPAQAFTGGASNGTTIRAYKYAGSILYTYTSTDGGLTFNVQQNNIGSANYQAGKAIYRNGRWLGLGATTAGFEQVKLWYSPTGLPPWQPAQIEGYTDTTAATMVAITANQYSRAVLVGVKASDGYAMTSPLLP